MSQHHRNNHWTTDSPKFRVIIAAQLPLPCVNVPCKHGGIVYPEQRWHVGHRPGHDASSGRRATIRDVGPAHAGCNLRDGGRAGARKTNAKRALKARLSPTEPRGGARPWL